MDLEPDSLFVDVARAALRHEPTAGNFADPRWPAHLHINVVPSARGTGAAEGLMTRWLARLRETGTPRCHLQPLVENVRAVRFFECMGFAAHGPTPLVPGVRYGGDPPAPVGKLRIGDGRSKRTDLSAIRCVDFRILNLRASPALWPVLAGPRPALPRRIA